MHSSSPVLQLSLAGSRGHDYRSPHYRTLSLFHPDPDSTRIQFNDEFMAQARQQSAAELDTPGRAERQHYGRRLLQGFGWGVAATVAMSLVMILGMVTGLSPMPKPIPVAVVASVLGDDLSPTALKVLGALSHLIYGGIWGAVLAAVARPVTLWKGIALGLVLWLIMQIIVLPFLGWGVFGAAQSPMIAVATLVLHLIYGSMLGWLLDRTAT